MYKFLLFLFLNVSLVSAQFDGLMTDRVVGLKATADGKWERIGTQTVDEENFKNKTYTVGWLNYHPAFFIDEQTAFSWYSWYGFSGSQSLFTAYSLLDPKKESSVWSMESSNNFSMLQTTDRNLELSNNRLDLVQARQKAQLLTYTQHRNLVNTTPANYALHLGYGGKWAKQNIPAFRGWVAELIQINHSISEVERLKIETYLAIKYGFTLDKESAGYLNSRDEVVLGNNPYFHRVFGLAKDTKLGLDQRQSQSSYLPGVLSLALGEHAPTHAENPISLNEFTYLLIGDDDKPLGASPNLVNQKWQTARSWQMQATESIDQPLEFKVNLDSLFTKEQQEEKTNAYLVLEDSPKNYIAPKTTENGMASFVLPNTKKGNTNFRFALAGDYFVDFEAQIEACNKQDGTISYTTYGLEAPFVLEIQKVGEANSLKTLRSRKETDTIENLSQGFYKIKLTDKDGKVVEDEVAVVPKNSPIEGQIQSFYAIQPAYPVDLNFPKEYKYQWLHDGVLVSTSNQFSIEKAGNYQLQVQSAEGCTWSYGFMVSRAATPPEPKTTLYPNPSDGNYKLSITLPEGSQEKQVRVSVYDVSGKLVKQKTVNGEVAYRLEGYIPTKGVYTIHIQWNGQSFNHQLMINE